MRDPKSPRPQQASPPGNPAQAIQQALPEIVRALIEQAREGSYQHARFLFELAGIARLQPEASAHNESLAALLLRELQIEK